MSDCKTLIFWLSEKEKHKTTVGIEHLESFEAVNNQGNLEDTYLIKEETKELLSALRQVKHPYGQVFWLRAYEEMSFKEIGEIFDKSENWARVNYFRAKTKIRKVIEDEITCDIVRDLMPLYVDDVCSDDSRKLIEDHINHCSKCQNELAAMKDPIECPPLSEVGDSKTPFSKIRKKSGSKWLLQLFLPRFL